MPPQPVHSAGAFGDQILAMIEQQADLHRLLVQIRDREPLDAVLDDRAGDRQRVDLIGLARLALPLPRGTHPVRRHPHDPLARRKQRLLEPARARPAVLDRPHAIVIQPTRPPDRGQMPRVIGLDLAGCRAPGRFPRRPPPARASPCAYPPRSRSCMSLRLVNAEWSGSPADTCHARRKPRFYQLTPAILGRRRATGALLVSPRRRRSSRESARRQPEHLPVGSDVTTQTQKTMTVTTVSADRRSALSRKSGRAF